MVLLLLGCSHQMAKDTMGRVDILCWGLLCREQAVLCRDRMFGGSPQVCAEQSQESVMRLIEQHRQTPSVFPALLGGATSGMKFGCLNCEGAVTGSWLEQSGWSGLPAILHSRRQHFQQPANSDAAVSALSQGEGTASVKKSRAEGDVRRSREKWGSGSITVLSGQVADPLAVGEVSCVPSPPLSVRLCSEVLMQGLDWDCHPWGSELLGCPVAVTVSSLGLPVGPSGSPYSFGCL